MLSFKPTFHSSLSPSLRGSVAQTVKCLPVMRETQVRSWVRKIPWRRKWQPTPVLLGGKFHGWRSLVGYSPWGCKELDLTEQLHFTSNYGEGNEDNGDLLQKVPCTQCPQPCSRPLPTHDSTGDSCTLIGKSGSVSCGVTAPFSWVLVHTRFCLCPPRVYFPVLCKFWQLYGGVNGDLLQESLCQTQVCCPQSPYSCSSPLLTHTFAGDTQVQFSLSLFGISGSWCTQGLFEPSEHL